MHDLRRDEPVVALQVQVRVDVMSDLETRLTGALASHVSGVDGDPDALVKILFRSHFAERSN